MDDWGFEQLQPWVGARQAMPVGPLFCVISGRTRGRELRVNRHKSAIARATSRPFLGFGFISRGGTVKIGVSPKSRQRAKDRLRQLTGRTWGVSMERRIHAINRFTVGWTAYFALGRSGAPIPRPR